MTLILNGKELAETVLSDIAKEVKKLSGVGVPGLGVILVGDNSASKAYVSSKEKAAKRCGFNTFNVHLPGNSTFSKVAEAVRAFNAQKEINGILVQLPLPNEIDSDAIIDLIDPAKDADGLHPYNQGLLLRGKGWLRPCTPLGCMLLLDKALLSADAFSACERADLSGKHAVVLGRSILVGKPLSLMLQERNATVTMAHSKTANLAAVCREADILVAAVGKPHLVTAEYVKPGAIVIDVGINRITSGSDAGKLTGDVDFERVQEKCSAITPVPGGVGPMTVAMLMYNTWRSFSGGAST